MAHYRQALDLKAVLAVKQANTTIPIKIKPLGFKLGLGINSKLGPYPKPRKRLLIRKKWVQLEFGVQSNGGTS